MRGSFQETAARKTAEHTVKHCDGGVGSAASNHRGGGESLMAITTLELKVKGQDTCYCTIDMQKTWQLGLVKVTENSTIQYNAHAFYVNFYTVRQNKGTTLLLCASFLVLDRNC